MGIVDWKKLHDDTVANLKPFKCINPGDLIKNLNVGNSR